MAEPAARLVVELSARTATFQRELAGAASAVKMRTSEIVGALEKVRGVAGAAFGGAIVASLSGMVTATVDAFDGFNDLADATGASVENISALDRIARETGGTFDSVATTLIKFNDLLGQTQDKGSKAGGIFKAIGLDAAELRKMDPAEALMKAAVALDGYADNGDKARVIQELFGKSVKEVAPLLKDLADKGRLVATVTKEQVEQGDAYKKMMSEMRANSEDFGRSISVAVLPHLNDLLKTMREFQKGPGVVAGLLDVFNPSGFASKQEGLNAYNAQIAELDAKVRALRDDKRPLIAANAANEIRALEERRKKLVQYADVYRNLVNADSAGGGRGAGPKQVDDKPSLDWSDPSRNKPGKAEKTEAEKQVEQGKKLAESLLQQSAGLSGDLMEKLEKLAAAYRKDAISIEQLTQANEVLLAQQPFAKAAADEATKAALAKTAAYEREIAETGRAVDAMRDANTAARQEVELIGLTEEAQRAVVRAREAHTIALREEQLARLSSFDLETRGAELLMEEIRLLKERQAINDGRTTAVLGEQERKDSADWAKGVGDDLKGAFQLAFNSAENPLQAFGKSLASTVYQRLSASAAEALAKAAMQAAGSSGGGIFGNLIGAVFSGLLGGGSGMSAGAYSSMTTGLYMADGGYTGPGGVHEPAGVVHKGEVVWSQADISKAGGVAVVESMRLGRRGYADGGIVGVTPAMSAGGRSRDRVIIQNFGAAQVETKEQKNAEGGIDTVVLLRQIESAMGANISNRSGPVYRSLASTFVPQGAR